MEKDAISKLDNSEQSGVACLLVPEAPGSKTAPPLDTSTRPDTAARHLPLLTIETGAQPIVEESTRGIVARSLTDEAGRLETSKIVPESMRYGAAFRAWDRLVPEEQKALASKIADLGKEMIADTKGLKSSEATKHPFILIKDEEGRVACLVDPSRNLRFHFRYDGKSDNVVAMVKEDTKTRAMTTYLAVQDPSETGKREWISVNSAGKRSEFVGEVTVGKGGAHHIKLESRKELPDLKDLTSGPEEKSTVSADRRRLEEVAEKAITDPERRKAYLANLDRFEKAAKSRGLSEKEISEFHRQSSLLLAAKDDAPVKLQDRVKLAEQALKQAIDPTCIKQGFFKTCNVSTVEVNMYTREPSKVLKAVTEAALTGKFTTVDGKTVPLPPGTFTPRAGERTFASQIFQNVAINTYWNEATVGPDRKPYAPGTIKYKHDGAPAKDSDTGQRLVTTDPTGKEIELGRSPHLGSHAYPEIYRRIAGKHPDTLSMIAAGKEEPDAKGVVKVDSPEKMHEKLAELSRKPGGFPIILRVHTSNEPFWTDSGAGAAGGAGTKLDEAKKAKTVPGGWHVVTITGYDARTRTAKVDNTWSESTDHLGRPGGKPGIALDELYKAMKMQPDRLRELGYEPKKK